LQRGPVIIVGTDIIVEYQAGMVTQKQYFLNNSRTKTWAAVRTLMFRSHYLAEKNLTNGFQRKARELLLENPEALIFYSLISTASLELSTGRAIVITQNDEIAWFQSRSLYSTNPLQKLTARISERWIKKFLVNKAKDYVFIHITEKDHQAYKQWLPEHKGFVVPAGVDMPQGSRQVPFHGKISLLFVGSLSVKMNYDALVFFGKLFWPVLLREFPKRIEVIVVGSQPSNQVRQLCQREGWQLIPDISDEGLQLQYTQADFAIIPHSYTHGAKLKLLNSLAAGLPVLATTNMCLLPHQDFHPNLYSDNPLEWRDHLRKFAEKGVSLQQHIDCQQFASRYTWEKIAAGMDRQLRRLGI
jgi:glycosyltransferase involved in cell wall biosynthesis